MNSLLLALATAVGLSKADCTFQNDLDCNGNDVSSPHPSPKRCGHLPCEPQSLS